MKKIIKNNSLMCQCWFVAFFIGYLAGLVILSYDLLNSSCLLSLAAIIPIKTYSIRSYSSSSAPADVVPEKYYSNADTLKQDILKENKQKSGVYR
jgi:hypothetical protein